MTNAPTHAPMHNRHALVILFLALLLLIPMSACTAGNPPGATATSAEAAEPTTAPTAVAPASVAAAPTDAGAAESAPTADLLLARVGINAEFEPFVYKTDQQCAHASSCQRHL